MPDSERLRNTCETYRLVNHHVMRFLLHTLIGFLVMAACAREADLPLIDAANAMTAVAIGHVATSGATWSGLAIWQDYPLNNAQQAEIPASVVYRNQIAVRMPCCGTATIRIAG
jgi:hypothetical protein